MRGCIRKSFLVKAIMKVVENTVDDVKFIITTMVCSVVVAVWHYECHQLAKEIKKVEADNLEEEKNKIAGGTDDLQPTTNTTIINE